MSFVMHLPLASFQQLPGSLLLLPMRSMTEPPNLSSMLSSPLCITAILAALLELIVRSHLLALSLLLPLRQMTKVLPAWSVFVLNSSSMRYRPSEFLFLPFWCHWSEMPLSEMACAVGLKSSTALVLELPSTYSEIMMSAPVLGAASTEVARKAKVPRAVTVWSFILETAEGEGGGGGERGVAKQLRA